MNPGPLQTIATWARMVKFSHSLFALPFALASAILATTRYGGSTMQWLWIVVAMVAARNAAMGFNRLVDQPLDAANPRTAERELPSGQLSRGAVVLFTLGLSLLFVVAAFQLNRLCGVLSPVALGIVFGYSFTKRFTWTSHLVLGLSLAIAPVGAWLAIAGEFSAVAWILGGAVLFWVAGFDIVYSCQDLDFDRRSGLNSIPARFGIRTALNLARAFHLLAWSGLVLVGVSAGLHPIYWIGCAIIAMILIWEHRIVRPANLGRIEMAFFNLNGTISSLYFAIVVVSILLGRI